MKTLFALGVALLATPANAQNCTSVVVGNTIHTQCDRPLPMPSVNFDWMSDAARIARERRARDERAKNAREQLK